MNKKLLKQLGIMLMALAISIAPVASAEGLNTQTPQTTAAETTAGADQTAAATPGDGSWIGDTVDWSAGYTWVGDQQTNDFFTDNENVGIAWNTPDNLNDTQNNDTQTQDDPTVTGTDQTTGDVVGQADPNQNNQTNGTTDNQQDTDTQNVLWQGRVNAAKSLHVRSTPTMGTNVIGYLMRDDVVNVLGTSAEDQFWCQIQFEDAESAWAACPYLTNTAQDDTNNAQGTTGTTNQDANNQGEAVGTATDPNTQNETGDTVTDQNNTGTTTNNQNTTPDTTNNTTETTNNEATGIFY